MFIVQPVPRPKPGANTMRAYPEANVRCAYFERNNQRCTLCVTVETIPQRPDTKSQSTKSSQERVSTRPAKQARILIADDSPRFRHALRRMLELRPGWSVCGEVENGDDAIRKVAALKPDLLILDIAMPTMNGLDAALTLAQTAPEVPILVLSMHAVKTYRTHALAAGVRGFVLKSEPVFTIMAAIQAVLRNEPFFSQEDLFHD